MKFFALSIAYDVGMLVFFSVWLWVLLRHRDLWLRYTAKEAAFWTRLHLPASIVAASRRFSEGRAVIYFTVVGLVIGLLFLIFSVGMGVYISVKHLDRPPNNSLQPTPVGRLNSAFAVDIARPAWLSFVR